MDTRYDEALERARAGMPIDEVFPELKESEDERIRKALIKQFSAISMETWAGIPKIDIISYLERQKEQKPANATQTDANKNANAEWSMGDENALVFFHELISFGLDEKFCDEQTADDMRKMLNTWVKSIRRQQSHWKPSEKQVRTLEQWLHDKQYDGDSRYVYPIFESLYNDLKKL